ncbi:hypothetical protein BKA70DRAFT_1309070 [Coprinopsis sp. MPI-PUGE-AT-0042]|nr:hypothetical protein BKA70DRAFT_1309070 [Coprinopsis sp. MPI-PUGE-AT-0042]
MAFYNLLVAFVALATLQVSAAPAETCLPDPCAVVRCRGGHAPVVVPATYPGGCSTCKCVPIPTKPPHCPLNPCEGVFCIATTNPTVVPGLHPGDCSTCQCVPIEPKV